MLHSLTPPSLQQKKSWKKSSKANLDILANVTTSGFEHSVITTDIGSGYDSRSANEGGSNVREDVTIEITANHNIELGRTRNQLIGCDG